MSDSQVSRRDLFRWVSWFGVINGAIYGLIGIRYILFASWPDDTLGQAYSVLAYIGQFAVLGWLPLNLLMLPVILLLPKPKVVLPLAVLLMALGATTLVLDTTIFAQYRYHLSMLTVAIFETSTWFLAGVVALVALAFQSLLAANTWARFGRMRKPARGVLLALTLVCVWLGSQAIHIWADATSIVSVTQFNRFLPLYFPIKAKRDLVKLGLLTEEEIAQAQTLASTRLPSGGGQLNYPLNPLTCSVDSPPNILIVMVDGMRPDAVSAEQTPAMAEFATQSQWFEQQYSGGNSSRMGFFSLFYGLPSTYWQTFYNLQQPPVLMQHLRKLDYQRLHVSAVGFGSPSQIDRTVLAGESGLINTEDGTYSVPTNQAVTDEFLDWYADRQPGEPWFSFLYYDPGTHGKVDRLTDAERAAAGEGEVAQKRAQYLKNLGYMDTQFERVIAALDAAEDRENTLVVLVSDHGYEFDENGLGYVGHASNFSRWQLQSVLAMDWPGRAPKIHTQRTAHQDFPGTVLSELFGCSNPISDYTSGGSLFSNEPWDWFIAGSYTSHAIVQPDRYVITYPGGLIELLGEDYRPSSELKLDPAIVEAAMGEMRRFYQ